MEILEVKQVNDALAEMVALFRVELRSYKGIVSKPNIEAGREEMEEYITWLDEAIKTGNYSHTFSTDLLNEFQELVLVK